MADDYLGIYRGLLAPEKRRRQQVNGTSSTAHRHQNGIDGGVYVGD
jgi:hypothetical protein